jgi:outer membrane protein assembly factor BamD
VAAIPPKKVLKSSNLEYKKAKATSWYYKKEYLKCIPVLEELMGLLKGRESIEELYYMYCMANYKQGDYMLSAYHFKNFYDQYTNSARAEECLFMHAKSYQQISPKYELDQTYTYKALEAYSLFLSMYPDNKFIQETNEAYSKLRKKLEKKALSNAELYYRTSNFKAAATTFAICSAIIRILRITSALDL